MGIGVLGGIGNPLVHAKNRAAMENKCGQEREPVLTPLLDVEGNHVPGLPSQSDTKNV